MDCSDNSDENQCGTCDFDQEDQNGSMSTCGWTNTGIGKNQWVVRKAKQYDNYYDILPNQDADGNRDGGFMIISTSMG